MSIEIEKVLEPQEKIVWQDVMNRNVMVFQLIVSLIIIGAISYFLFSQETINYTSNNVSKSIDGSAVGLVFLLVGLIISLIGFFSNFVKIFVLTNKRAIIKSGLIGTDYNSIYLNEIKTVNVNVDLIEKIFSVGNINIDSGKVETVTSGNSANRTSGTRTAYDRFIAISKPYEVYKYFQTSLTGRQESLYSGRADRENNQSGYLKQ